MTNLNIDTVTDWTWTRSENHNGSIPEMPECERREWSRLSDEKCMRRLTRDEAALLRALDRKISYRAGRDDSGRW